MLNFGFFLTSYFNITFISLLCYISIATLLGGMFLMRFKKFAKGKPLNQQKQTVKQLIGGETAKHLYIQAYNAINWVYNCLRKIILGSDLIYTIKGLAICYKLTILTFYLNTFALAIVISNGLLFAHMIVCCSKCDEEGKGFSQNMVKGLQSAKLKLSALMSKIPKYNKEE